VVMACVLALPLVAQEPVLRLGQAQDPNAQLKDQVRIFEAVVQQAVQRGGRRLATRAREVVPNVDLIMDGQPIVTGVMVPEVGFHFDVQVPDILETGLRLFELQRKNPGPMPMAALSAAARDFDPGREYAAFVREALVDAMLDQSFGLPLQPGERLILVARVPQNVQLNQLYLDDSRKLVLAIAGEDLQAFRQQRITREEARDRIKESRF
jgi:hypothetical protein